MNTIYITGLQVDMRVGVYDWERTAHQPLRLDLELTLPDGVPLSDGDRRATVDYGHVVEAVRAFIGTREDALLETLGEALCAHLLERFEVREARLRIDKPQAALLLGCAHVGIDLVRRR
jgi:7,8-dihydroneopterin aldolase/epimerase/oxygenase